MLDRTKPALAGNDLAQEVAELAITAAQLGLSCQQVALRLQGLQLGPTQTVAGAAPVTDIRRAVLTDNVVAIWEDLKMMALEHNNPRTSAARQTIRDVVRRIVEKGGELTESEKPYR